ncbi:MAG: proline dehydrogenase family protein [Bacteroidota bacterium]
MSTTDLSFQNTSVAFAHKSNGDLAKARWLFRSFNYPALLTYGPTMAKAAVFLGLKFTIKKTIFQQFCGGENIQECDTAIENLSNSGIGTILDYSVEGEESEATFDETCAEVLRTIERAKGNPNIPFSVFKTTGICSSAVLEAASSIIEENQIIDIELVENGLPEGLREGWKKSKARFMQLCSSAAQSKVRIFVDAEETWLQPAIDLLATHAMELLNKDQAWVFNTLQMYRHDRLAYLERQVAEGKCYYGYKLVRGAYMEKERARAAAKGYQDPIQSSKEATDTDYDRAVAFCLDNHNRVSVCIATHNEKSSLLGTELLNKHQLPKGDWNVSFSQLLGMSDHISFNLSNSGYKVSKYVPYGPVLSVIPYLTRRAQENSGMAGQMGRELALIEAEIKRRKS